MVVEKVETEEQLNKPISIEDLKNVWSEFISIRKQETKPSELVILNQPYFLAENKITLQLTNPVQIEQLNGFKVELLSYLRTHLQNFSLEINPVIAVEEEKKIIYTSSDKLNYLIKKNPALLELKQKLGLDLDYS